MDAVDAALGENAAAKAVLEAMEPSEREAVRRRLAAARSREELDGAIDALLGSRRGHPPYQL